MATIREITEFLRPNGGYSIRGTEYEGIEFINCKPFTKKDYQNAFNQYEMWLQAEDEAKATARQALLDKLGITADEAKLLLG